MRDQITIALPVYKRTDFIRQALDSAVNQTKPCSILLIDNNSPHDEFKTIIDSYKNADIKYIGEMVQRSDQEMLRTKNFGRKSLNEIKEILHEMGLDFGMKLEGFPERNELDRKYTELKETD